MVRGKGNIIDGEHGHFDLFFKKLYHHISEETKNIDIFDSTSSIEQFLRSIGYEHELRVPRSRYKNLQSLYVKPTEYDEICSKLEKDHVVFIIGEPHLGKTYTAIYLLWDCYQKGYETIHIRHDKLVSLLNENEESTEKVLRFLIHNKEGKSLIIHFDDPFGETIERRTDEFAKGLSSFLALSRKYEHLRIVVTTRLNIFRDSLIEYKCENIEELERDLRVHTSYKKSVLLEILHKYTDFYEPLWSTDEGIVAELDEKLPEMIPAPHNIEFFVRTSERLTSLKEILLHVEESKEMVKALGNWMADLPDYEQLFLILVEVCSTVNVLFPDKLCSKMNLENAYRETLSYMFKRKYLDGIPTGHFSLVRDKFEVILLESRDQESKLVKFDFVHPSYHEAFWYAIKKESRLSYWWRILKENLDKTLKDIEYRIDLVQMRMIENYGTINRDLDKLLLISAESDDKNEQLIALKYMLERSEKFTNLPNFYDCVSSIVTSEEEDKKIHFLELLDGYFDNFSLDSLEISLSLLFDRNSNVERRAEEVLKNHELSTNWDSIQEFDVIISWKKVQYLKMLSPQFSENHYISKEAFIEENKKAIDLFTQLSFKEFKLLLKYASKNQIKLLLYIIDYSWRNLPIEKKSHLKSILISNDNFDTIQSEQLIINHYEDFSDLSEKYPFIRDLEVFKSVFNTKLKVDKQFTRKFESAKIHCWKGISPELFKILINSPTSYISDLVIKKVIENYDQIPSELKTIFESEQSEKVQEFWDYYIEENKYNFESISSEAMISLSSWPGLVQYEIFTGLLVRFGQLPPRLIDQILKMINHPQNWWIGGSIGQMTSKKFIYIDVFKLPLKIRENKSLLGALLAEMIQIYFDEDFGGLQEKYKDCMYNLSKDPEITTYAEKWIDYQFKYLEFYREDYWLRMKNNLSELSRTKNEIKINKTDYFESESFGD